MSTSRLCGVLVDSKGRSLGSVDVSWVGTLYVGDVDLSGVDSDLVSLFDEYEDVVMGQVLSLLDEQEDSMSKLGARFVSDDNLHVLYVCDLQMYPKQRRVAFRIKDDSPLAGST